MAEESRQDTLNLMFRATAAYESGNTRQALKLLEDAIAKPGSTEDLLKLTP